MKTATIQGFSSTFGEKPRYLFSAPGRAELSGNHTDHQHGCVMAAAIDKHTLAAVRENGTNTIRVLSEGYPMCEICLDALDVQESERNTTASLIRGIAARFASFGCTLGGFDAYVTSTVLPGSGLSSSAAFEVLIGTIINHLFYGKATPVQIAQIGQYAENVYFGKPCGLMDQTASAVGNIIAIDFADPESPIVERMDFDFAACGYSVCIVDSGADHAELTHEYAAIPEEMGTVSRVFGKTHLRDVDEAEFYKHLPQVRKAAGDRACLRAMHFFEENRRVAAQIEALKNGDFERFLYYVNESGRSSWQYLQNVIPAGEKAHQEMALALAVVSHLLAGRGACRVHGGGFAGTLLAFVPNDMLDAFRTGVDKTLGEGSCHTLSIRPEGGILLEELT
ncbi:MAG: galactokinase [Oscillospiraceae bacterium]|nr:galactokinase [Oscillospiraceae bacterium]